MIKVRGFASKLFLSAWLISLTFLFQNSAHGEIVPLADGSTLITLSDLPNRDINGFFFDRSLEARLGETGSLGRLLNEVERIPASKRNFAVDPMLIEEVVDLADGFITVDGSEVSESPNAGRWLDRLKVLVAESEVKALNYGSPDVAWLSKSAPSELRVHHRLSAELLASLIPVTISGGLPESSFSATSINPSITSRYTQMRRSIRSINQYAANPTTVEYRLKIGSILNPKLSKERSLELTRALQKKISSYQDSIRISKGRFTLTSSSERVPITLINDFENPLEIRLKIKSTNSKVIVTSTDPVTVDANSKISIEVPVTVLASGQSELLITMKTTSGIEVGDQVRLPLTLTVISPFTTWITTGSGLVLLIAAIIQSMRRVRRSRRKSGSAERVKA